jgi:hypothetical protein
MFLLKVAPKMYPNQNFVKLLYYLICEENNQKLWATLVMSTQFPNVKRSLKCLKFAQSGPPVPSPRQPEAGSEDVYSSAALPKQFRKMPSEKASVLLYWRHFDYTLLGRQFFAYFF